MLLNILLARNQREYSITWCFLPNVKYFENKIGIQFNNPPLVIEQESYALRKVLQSGYGIAFDGKGSWSFGYDFARNVIVLGVHNSSSSHTGNLK